MEHCNALPLEQCQTKPTPRFTRTPWPTGGNFESSQYRRIQCARMDDAGSNGEKEKKKRSWHENRDAERAAQRKVREEEREQKRLEKEKEREEKQKVRKQRADEVRHAKEERSRIHNAGLGLNKEVRTLQLLQHQPCL